MVFRKNDPYNELDATRGAHPLLSLFISGERCSRESRGRSTVLSVNSLSPESRGAVVRANLVESTRLVRALTGTIRNGNWRAVLADTAKIAHSRTAPHHAENAPETRFPMSLWLDSITWPA